jgi:hypothetical protein
MNDIISVKFNFKISPLMIVEAFFGLGFNILFLINKFPIAELYGFVSIIFLIGLLMELLNIKVDDK